ncbi:unnamed protein product [Cladocopium goreaui]|uniref:Uncharacterized protein n=1 Tax=Cladocopium goreaui TaxID=2562237 RepID=A0A9P1GDZ0_9DINO|nr:unnamed protein product [Cladocopium goreaui]|mmetsp:Transcript_27528/g.59902  ORF Transcript_27528/g.59902 Transcript_27528/m.59902 type:complete len:110 (-) Transcript_27528:95-424(-)
MTHQRNGLLEGHGSHIEFQDLQYATGHIQRMYRFYMFLPEQGKPYKTMWVTDLEYVKKERDRCLKLLEKKSQKRKKSPGSKPLTVDPYHPRAGEIPHGLVLSSSRFLSN